MVCGDQKRYKISHGRTRCPSWNCLVCLECLLGPERHNVECSYDSKMTLAVSWAYIAMSWAGSSTWVCLVCWTVCTLLPQASQRLVNYGSIRTRIAVQATEDVYEQYKRKARQVEEEWKQSSLWALKLAINVQICYVLSSITSSITMLMQHCNTVEPV